MIDNNLQDFQNNTPTNSTVGNFDYSYAPTIARVAVYDDFKSAPHVIEIQPNTTNKYIENLTTTIYEQAKLMGGSIAYTIIREVAENFIHAQFSEIVVSILDKGNTIRFTDQGPGIIQKEKAQLPGFTSAIEPMKHYIRGIGSGLPTVNDYLNSSHGSITIEDNLKNGAVVTISLKPKLQKNDYINNYSQPQQQKRGLTNPILIPSLSQREKDFLFLFFHEGALGVTEISRLTNVSPSSTHSTLTKLEQAGLIEKAEGKKRILTNFGYNVAETF